MATNTLLRRIIGAAWLIISVLAFVFLQYANITLASVANIAFASCLLLVGWKDDRDAKWGSFVWGWASFYMVTTSLFALYIAPGVGGGDAGASFSPLSGPLWYHLLSNVALLSLFWLHLDRVPWAFRGWWSAMIGSVVLFPIVWLTRWSDVLPDRGFLLAPQFIGGFLFIGLALALCDFVFLRNAWESMRVIKTFRSGSQVVLWILLLAFVFLFGLAVAGSLFPTSVEA
ncbi:MAG: hypothetical protein Q7S89_01940 [bacterium]|nr:hypothetical protein [bacterium]